MEIIGDDKKIRALFSEAKLADAQATPSFTSQWNRAQSRALRPRRAFTFKLSFAAVTAVLVCALISLAVWSQYSRPPVTYSAFANVPAVTSSSGPEVRTAVEVPTPNIKIGIVHRTIRPRARSTAQSGALTVASNANAAKEATNIDNWQSPTAALLSSSSDGLFKSLPQLNENANEMKSVLPGRANEKEK
jgi:di/tricarboxylate transporter